MSRQFLWRVVLGVVCVAIAVFNVVAELQIGRPAEAVFLGGLLLGVAVVVLVSAKKFRRKR